MAKPTHYLTFNQPIQRQYTIGLTDDDIAYLKAHDCWDEAHLDARPALELLEERDNNLYNRETTDIHDEAETDGDNHVIAPRQPSTSDTPAV